MKDIFKMNVDDYIDELTKDASDMIKGVKNTISYTTAQALSSDLNKLSFEYEIRKENVAEVIMAAKALYDNPELGKLTDKEIEELENKTVDLGV